MSDPRILQIMPSDGWGAALLVLDYDAGAPEVFEEPLVAWALVEDTQPERRGERELEGMVRLAEEPAFVVRCPAIPAETREYDVALRFVGYLRPGERATVHSERANETYARWREGEKNTRELLEAGWVQQESKSYARRWRSPDGREMDPRQAVAEFRGGGASK